jgi:hypothetical protein
MDLASQFCHWCVENFSCLISLDAINNNRRVPRGNLYFEFDTNNNTFIVTSDFDDDDDDDDEENEINNESKSVVTRENHTCNSETCSFAIFSNIHVCRSNPNLIHRCFKDETCRSRYTQGHNTSLIVCDISNYQLTYLHDDTEEVRSSLGTNKFVRSRNGQFNNGASGITQYDKTHKLLENFFGVGIQDKKHQKQLIDTLCKKHYAEEVHNASMNKRHIILTNVMKSVHYGFSICVVPVTKFKDLEQDVREVMIQKAIEWFALLYEKPTFIVPSNCGKLKYELFCKGLWKLFNNESSILPKQILSENYLYLFRKSIIFPSHNCFDGSKQITNAKKNILRRYQLYLQNKKNIEHVSN